MKKISSIIVLVLALCASSVFAQERGATALMGRQPLKQPTVALQTVAQPAPRVSAVQTNRVSTVVKEKSRISYSVHSRGFIGNYEIVTLRERGLWGNGCVTQLLVDARTGEPVVVLNSSASAGPGIAMVQGASFVGGMYLFAEHLRPNRENINSNNSNSGNAGTGSTTINNSNTANGGAGGSASANNTGAGSGQTVNVNSGNANGNGQITLGGGNP